MILKLDIDNLTVSQHLTAEELIKNLFLSQDDAVELISNTILTLGLAVASQARQYAEDLSSQQFFILAVTSAANKIVTESYEDHEEDDPSEDDEY